MIHINIHIYSDLRDHGHIKFTVHALQLLSLHFPDEIQFYFGLSSSICQLGRISSQIISEILKNSVLSDFKALSSKL